MGGEGTWQAEPMAARIAWVVAAAPVLWLLAGCGDGGGDDGAERAAWVRDLCRAVEAAEPAASNDVEDEVAARLIAHVEAIDDTYRRNEPPGLDDGEEATLRAVGLPELGRISEALADVSRDLNDTDGNVLQAEGTLNSIAGQAEIGFTSLLLRPGAPLAVTDERVCDTLRETMGYLLDPPDLLDPDRLPGNG